MRKLTHLKIKFLNKIKLLKYFNLKETLFIEKEKFTIPIYESIGMGLLYYQRDWMNDVLNILSKTHNGILIDVGANLGDTLLSFKLDNPNGEYIGFEPNPICFSYVNNFIQSNNLRNAAIFNLGLSNNTKVNRLILNNSTDVDSSASMIGELRPGKGVYKTIEFISMKLDEFIVGSAKMGIGIIKIDVEGAEYEVLTGAIETIKQFRPIIICEILNADSYESLPFVKNRTKAIVALLFDLNYAITRIKKDNNRFLKLENIHDIHIGLYAEEDNDLCDYLFIPKEKSVNLL